MDWEELLDDDVYCEYALLIRDGGNASINGYYTCSGKKNDHYMFSHMSDELAALYWAKNGTWMIVYDDELLYGNPLKYDSVGGRDILMFAELNLYPPPPRCWYAIEGMNPPPGVMWMEITDDPMAWLDDDLAARCKERNLNEQYMNKLKVDLPVQMIDFMFCGPIGFALRIDGDSKVMDVIRVRDDGQAKQLGLMHGDTLLRINEEEISKKPEIAFPLLKQCVLSDVAFEVTFLRKKFDELVIDVRRAGSAGCNGKYVFFRLDEFDAPIFVKDNDRETWRICRLDHDDEEGQSIWAIQNMTDNTEYYIGYSDSYSPPNNAWETVEEVAANPAPGLQFIAIDNQMMKKLVPDMPKIRQNIFVATKRRRGKAMNANAFDEAKILEEDTTLDSFKLAVFEAQERERSISATPAGTPSPRDGFNLARTDSIMSTASVYAIPDEVQGALVDYQSQIAGLEKELKAERKRALTLTHQHKTHQSVLKEHEEKLQTEKQGFDQQIEWFRHELYTVNNAYYELWIKQSDARLDFHKINKESHKMKGKFAQTKKQLFQAKRKIDDLVDDLDDAQRELDQNTAHHAADKTEQDLASLVSLNRNLDLLELETEIGSFKAQLAAKAILIEELNADNDKWQEAHDSIFERMTEAQTRLAKECQEFEDAKRFYENKLSILRDQIQDNSIQFWEYEKRIKQITQRYETDTNGKVLPLWPNQPRIRIGVEEKRISITLQGKGPNKARDSVLSMSGDWDALTPRPDNDDYRQNDTLHDATEPDDSDDDDANNAFGFTTTFNDDDDDDPFGAFGGAGNDDEQFECDDDEDGAGAFGMV